MPYPATAEKRGKKAWARLLPQYKRLGCLDGNKQSYVWKLSVVNAVIAREERTRTAVPKATMVGFPGDTGTSTSMKSGTNGSGKVVVLIDTLEELNRVKQLPPFSRGVNMAGLNSGGGPKHKKPKILRFPKSQVGFGLLGFSQKRKKKEKKEAKSVKFLFINQAAKRRIGRLVGW